MSSHSTINDNHKKNTKRIAAIPMAGAIITAAILLSGLSLIGSYQQALAQQNMTGSTGGATTNDTATTTMGGGNTTTGGAGGNDSMSQVRMHLEEARTAIQNNDTQGALMHLDLAINAMGGASPIQGNLTGTEGGTTGGNMTTGGAGTEGGTTGGAGTEGGTTGGAGTEGGTTGGAGTEGGTTGGAGTEGGGGGILEGIFGGGGQ
jgi:hypothetical protein